MSLPSFWTFLYASAQMFNWGPVVDGVDYAKDPSVLTFINDAVVTISLYTGRDRTNPVQQPGAVVPGFVNINVPYVSSSSGLYAVQLSGISIPAPGNNYVLVIDTVRPGNIPLHYEMPAVVVVGPNSGS